MNFGMITYTQNIQKNYMDMYSFIVYVKTEDVYEGIEKDDEKRFDALIMSQQENFQKEKVRRSFP